MASWSLTPQSQEPGVSPSSDDPSPRLGGHFSPLTHFLLNPSCSLRSGLINREGRGQRGTACHLVPCPCPGTPPPPKSGQGLWALALPPAPSLLDGVLRPTAPPARLPCSEPKPLLGPRQEGSALALLQETCGRGILGVLFLANQKWGRGPSPGPTMLAAGEAKPRAGSAWVSEGATPAQHGSPEQGGVLWG